ncbi:RidA family protein [Xanthomarina gelatinilytica]|uniref:RidA family protein n=1 Tax=Xanthomarina gelatinilytica TaxID=1137281 RepID=UPI003AA8E3E5
MNKIIEQPIPQGKYLPAIRNADIIYTSGMTPRKYGKLLYFGKIKITDPIQSHREAIRLATLNALTAVQNRLEAGEKIVLILQLNVFLNAEEGFTAHANAADYASELLIENLGTNCIGSRAAIGVASLPSNSPVEITMTAKVDINT